MDWTHTTLDTLIPQIPKILEDNFKAFKNYLDVFYDETNGLIIKPVNTTGRIKGGTGEFVNIIVDNLTVKKQFTNKYENTTTIDSDFVTAFNGAAESFRDACTGAWPIENDNYEYIDVQTPYIKINNSTDIGLQCTNLGQQTKLIFDVVSGSDFIILLDSSAGERTLIVSPADASGVFVTLITTKYDASFGYTWTVKEGAGTYSIVDA